ncbi:MAG: peptidyl-prolyl cis-trans isomerase [Bacteroidetes bacterium]|nr:peptidyl-prolyl cis-trans isomerase [Rhodothermia bacterium]MCS7155788.1 peptidyl-prolyl cis-trans isomerase [Bacteroidota bacterium]MCX7906111.1 peptidyl-prolyl cis-trans isomerase [Bacteroidota bacterium]MDW8138239.1 peptidyl-prolyl cis-trans isomerase [Bacteroidota bacterium]MDW8285923.1 peptidyl-prolyl cis-trans isomerase [Bacteroidota bacterium]
MGLMSRLRDNTHLILWTLVIAFGLIWVMTDAGLFEALGTQRTHVGEVDGHPITYQEYTETVDRYLQAYQQQTGEGASPQMVELYRDMAWQSLTNDILRRELSRRLGLRVSESEILELVVGENPDPFIQQQFAGPDGRIDRNALLAAIRAPETREGWLQVEDYLRRKREAEKLEQLIASIARVSEGEIRYRYYLERKTVDIEYVMLSYASIPESELKLTDGDLRRYYSAHRGEYRVPAAYTIEYVLFSKKPTRQDTLRTIEELAQLKNDFAQTQNDSLFLVQHGSLSPYSRAFVKLSELAEPLANAIERARPGEVVGPLNDGTLVHVVKVLETRTAQEPVVRARHILIAFGTDKAEARRKAESVLARLRAGEDFAAVAREVSQDPGSASRGGDLGWFGRGRMVKEFEEAAFGARPGQLLGPVETSFGYHIIRVEGRSTAEYRIADLSRRIEADPTTTVARVQESAEDFRYFARESGFDQEAQRRGLQVQTFDLTEESRFVPGVGVAGPLLHFAKSAKIGEISPPIEMDESFVVARLKSRRPEGYRPYEEVKEAIRAQVLQEERRKLALERLRKAAEAHKDLAAVAQALSVSVQTAQGLSLQNPVLPAVGSEPVLIAAALGLRTGQISPVLAGQQGAYLLRAVRVTEPDLRAIPAADRQRIREALLSQKRSQLMGQWLQELRKRAKIEDRRHLFLRPS